MSDTALPVWTDFAGKNGCACTVAAGEDRHAFTLEQAENLGGTLRAGGSFRLVFRGPVDPLLPQGTYRVMAEGFDVQMFLVPIARDARGSQYEAIFN